MGFGLRAHYLRRVREWYEKTQTKRDIPQERKEVKQVDSGVLTYLTVKLIADVAVYIFLWCRFANNK
jgi:hypothetical protein